MRKAVLGSIAAITAGAGLAAGQSPQMLPSAMPAPVSVAPGGGVMTAGMMDGMQMPPDATPMMPPGGPMPSGGPMMPPGPYAGDMGMGGPPGGYAPIVDHTSRLAPKFEFNGKTLLYFVKAQPTPGPLVTTSAPGAGGILGQPSTQVLYGGGDFGMGLFSGFDLSGVLWRDPDRRIGIQLGGMLLEQKSNSIHEFSDTTGQPLLARPFFNADFGVNDSILTSFPNAIAGGINASASTQLYGAEGNFLWNVYRSCPGDCCMCTFNWIGGFRWLELNEHLNISQTSILINGATAAFDQKVYTSPATFTIRDNIQALNQFYGGQIGFNGDIRYNRVFLAYSAKLGLGVMHQKLNIAGLSSIQDPNTGANSVIRGGLLANASNIGKYNNDEFAVVPEFFVTMGYNWTSWFTTTVGYGATYMDQVIRPGDQISTTVSSALIVGHPNYGAPATPVANPAFTQSHFWAQGVQLGFIFRW